MYWRWGCLIELNWKGKCKSRLGPAIPCLFYVMFLETLVWGGSIKLFCQGRYLREGFPLLHFVESHSCGWVLPFSHDGCEYDT